MEPEIGKGRKRKSTVVLVPEAETTRFAVADPAILRQAACAALHDDASDKFQRIPATHYLVLNDPRERLIMNRILSSLHIRCRFE